MPMRKAARAPSGCIKNPKACGFSTWIALGAPFTVRCHACSQYWSQGGAASFRLLAGIPEIFLVATVT
jgi:hypothetical protein